MNMLVNHSLSATPNGTTRPQVRIVIVGHVDHGKSTLVGRLLHETGSLPEGKLDMLKAVSARRGMPFEWSFLLDALQTERDQGITIDTTQIRFRTGSRDVVLIDAPGHAEFLRNMITGASQADGAVLIIDALEGVRDQTRRHGYLLHLLGIKQVAIVVGHAREKVEAAVRAHAGFHGLKISFVHQAEQRGTGHALMTAREALGGFSHVLVLSGDVPLIHPETIERVRDFHITNESTMTILTAEPADSFGYKLLWVVVLANCMAMLFQGLSAKRGIVTGKNLAELARERVRKPVAIGMWIVSEFGAMATDLA